MPTSTAVTAGLRALYEGAPPTIETLALVSHRSPRLLAKVARQQGWGVAGIQAAGPPGEPVDPGALERRLTVLADRLVRDLEAVSAAGEEAGGYDKARIDALSAMLRMVEKIGEITRGPERAKENQIKSDAEMAAALERINNRIVELATELAGQMVAGEHQAGTGA